MTRIQVEDPAAFTLLGALMDQMVAGIFAGKSYAYVPVMGEKSGYRPGIAVEGESGYNPINGATFDTYAEATEFCDGMNKHIGLSKEKAMDIIASSMRKN